MTKKKKKKKQRKKRPQQRTKKLPMPPVKCEAGHTLQFNLRHDPKTNQARLQVESDAGYDCALCTEIYDIVVEDLQSMATRRGIQTLLEDQTSGC